MGNMSKLIHISEETERILNNIRIAHKCSYNDAIIKYRSEGDRTTFEQIFDSLDGLDRLLKQKTAIHQKKCFLIRECLTLIVFKIIESNHRDRDELIQTLKDFRFLVDNITKRPPINDTKNDNSAKYLVDQDEQNKKNIEEFLENIKNSKPIM